MTKIKIIIILLIVGFSFNVKAQQTPQFTQYMYNMSIINPAYTTGQTEAINFGLIHRKQWTGLNGPLTTSFFAHKAFTDNVEAGISFTNDKVGNFLHSKNINADYAYKLNLGNQRSLSFGIKAGVNIYDTDFSSVELESTTPDKAFENDISKAFLNFGLGAYYNTDKFYAGLSVANLINSKHIDVSNGEYVGREAMVSYLTAGYVFNLSDQFKLKPAFMTKYVQGSPISLDATANILYNNRIELGAGYRLEESFSGLINIRITPELRIGYAYDRITNNLNAVTSASHEFILLYDLGLLFNKGYDKSPRFF
ncbi:type IX secretion system membrane protein PorP/SprF [Flavobacterium sp. NG2]|uniref:PorP/SprF family type IX secretion system membrane protein n=1 Tax=Flavobacterium sp. NG2 TaxID=3097547 RepID=UPI002A7EC873|nr:type IX secretion system membrane protein PorP/SprF [Flavobacterium sp. NG2]WPR72679.1 type IX secretion system membrane protein PorP/SprF [Flavobacterium sp. NG2]